MGRRRDGRVARAASGGDWFGLGANEPRARSNRTLHHQARAGCPRSPKAPAIASSKASGCPRARCGSMRIRRGPSRCRRSSAWRGGRIRPERIVAAALKVGPPQPLAESDVFKVAALRRPSGPTSVWQNSYRCCSLEMFIRTSVCFGRCAPLDLHRLPPAHSTARELGRSTLARPEARIRAGSASDRTVVMEPGLWWLRRRRDKPLGQNPQAVSMIWHTL
jgi:hypothetical protein